MKLLHATKDTVITAFPKQLSELPANQKFNLLKGEELKINWILTEGDYFKFELVEPKFGRYNWYSPSTEAAIKSAIAGAFSPQQNAFLDTIAYAEGCDRHLDRNRTGYDVQFTHKKFTDFKDHPREKLRSGSLVSDAAGRYQFLSSTWDECAQALDLNDFSPENQDKACLYLIQRRRALHYVDAGDIEGACEKLSWEWASLPYDDKNGRYGQPTVKMAELKEVYERVLQFYLPLDAMGIGTQRNKIYKIGDYLPTQINLKVPFLSQRDNEDRPHQTCNVTCCAMVLNYYGIKGKGLRSQLEDELEDAIAKIYGRDGIYYHNNLAKILQEYGLKNTFKTNATWEEIKVHLANGNPVIYSGKFTQGGHIIVLRGYEPTGFRVNDPWGEWFSWGYSKSSGENLHYSYQLISRVSYGGNNSGWAHLVCR
jgi:muramidase (phage lysozyme)/uncharacterized protein YvpB